MDHLTNYANKFLNVVLDISYSMRTHKTFYLLQDYTFVLPLSALAIYLIIITQVKTIQKISHYIIPSFIRNLSIKPILIVWNLFFSVFSFYMFIGVGIPYLAHLRRDGFFETFCDTNRTLMVPDATKPDMLMWGGWFVLSKYLELFDTIFVLIKNPDKKVEFLHLWHHFTVLFFTWFSWYNQYTPSFYFCLMNSFIHVIMYFYYFLKEINIHPAWNKILTAGQTIQMFIGMFLNFIFVYFYVRGELGCNSRNVWIQVFMSVSIYFSYLVLFMQFYSKKYEKKVEATPEKKQE